MSDTTGNKLLEIYDCKGVFELLSRLEKYDSKDVKLIEFSKCNVKSVLLVNIDSGKTVSWSQMHQQTMITPETTWDIYYLFKSGNIIKGVSNNVISPSDEPVTIYNFKYKHSKSLGEMIMKSWFNGIIINNQGKTLEKDNIKLQIYYYDVESMLL